MNLELKKKDILKNFNNIIYFGYCELYPLEKYLRKLGYTKGVYGWNANVYIINNNTCFVTGYRPFGNINGNKYKNLIKEYAKNLDELLNKKGYVNVNLYDYIQELSNKILRSEFNGLKEGVI